MSEPIKFSDRLRRFREINDVTQKEMGDKLGVSANYVGMIEGGKEIDERSSIYKLFELLEKGWSPKSALRAAREESRMSVREAAAALGVEIGVYQAIEQGGGKASERLIEKFCELWPQLDKSELMFACDGPCRVHEESAQYGMVGQKPEIELPGGVTARYVPLISWAQAGTMKSFDDQAYQYEAHLAFNVTDRRAIAISIRGDSMRPMYEEGDIVILYPSTEPRNGELVIARLNEDEGGDVMFKIFNPSRGGKVVLTSYNPAYPPLNFAREDFAWIYPAASVVKNLRK